MNFTIPMANNQYLCIIKQVLFRFCVYIFLTKFFVQLKQLKIAIDFQYERRHSSTMLIYFYKMLSTTVA